MMYFRIMKLMKWDYYTLMKQPNWLIENIHNYLNAKNTILNERVKDKNYG